MHRFKDLKVWQKSVELTIQVYQLTRAFPKSEQFGLVQQINRSVVSIPSNIAEGAGRNTQKNFKHFLSIAFGSACELETQLIISRRLELINEKQLETILESLTEIKDMLFSLQHKLSG